LIEMANDGCDGQGSMSEGPQITLTRRAVCAGGIGLLGAGLGGCSFVSLETQNFRLTVEDNTGKVLGSGVWQWQENVPRRAMHEFVSKDGEAFPIVHPALGKMYVTRGANSGWGSLSAEATLKQYQKAGLIPEFERHAPHGGVGKEGYRQLALMTTRVQLPREHTPGVVKFADERNPKSARIVMTHSRTATVEVELRFFVQPTRDRMTTGILGQLPWLNSLPTHLLSGTTRGTGEKDIGPHRDAARLIDSDFVTHETRIRLARARKN
jgi:hypothetical protein